MVGCERFGVDELAQLQPLRRMAAAVEREGRQALGAVAGPARQFKPPERLQGYKDNRPEYFLGAEGDAHRRKFAEAGVIGVYFGGGASGMSGYANDVYTDGQLFMKSRGGAFLNTGGLPID
jgi:hypothetical protein